MSIPPWQFQRAYTPQLIKLLLQITCAVTLVSVALEPWLGLQELLSVNPLFYSSYYIWQPITSLFLVPALGFTFGFLVDFAFLMLVFWLFGSLVCERIGNRQFLVVYFASGILSGLTALSVMHKFQLFSPMSECMPMLLAITTLWAMIDPYQQILLFFVLPIKAKWVLVAGLFGTLFVSFVQQDVISFAAYFIAFLFAYLWGLSILNLRSPFDWMTGLDRLLARLKGGFSRFLQWNILGPIRKAREALRRREEAFVDATLEKISREGENSIGLWAKLRLKWVSFKKRVFSRK